MGFNKKTVKDIDLKGKRVLVRADYNVPVKDGKISDDYRIKQSVQTIKYIWEQYRSSIVIMSHLGRPDGKPSPEFSLKPVAKRLSELLDKKVEFVESTVGEEAKRACEKLEPGQILLLENLRFDGREEKNDKQFAKELVETTKAEVFVQDGFGVVHRAHASTDAITKLLPSVAGLLLEKEVATIDLALEAPIRPLAAVIGGAKIADKIDVIKRFIEVADCVIIGGALANDFLLAEKIKVGASLVDKDQVNKAAELLGAARKAEKKRAFNLLVPVDVVVSDALDGKSPTRVVDLGPNCLADIESYPKIPKFHNFEVAAHESIGDIGPVTAGLFAGAIKNSRTVIWSGTMGVTEVKGIAGAHPPFSHGTRMVAGAIIGASNAHAHKPVSIAGGGDTSAWIEGQHLVDDFNHVSTGGSACLELMAGHKLPGVEALENKN